MKPRIYGFVDATVAKRVTRQKRNRVCSFEEDRVQIDVVFERSCYLLVSRYFIYLFFFIRGKRNERDVFIQHQDFICATLKILVH